MVFTNSISNTNIIKQVITMGTASKGKQVNFDMDKDFKNIIGISSNSVIGLGGLGCFDEHGIFPLNVYRDRQRILGDIGDWSRRDSDSVETSIGVHIREDNV